MPVVKYPLITILEINNTDNVKFNTSAGEQVSDLAYQFDAISGNRAGNIMATTAAMSISAKIDNFIKTYSNGRYKQMHRTGRSAILPLPNDSTKIKSSTTYECSLELSTNTIFKKS